MSASRRFSGLTLLIIVILLLRPDSLWSQIEQQHVRQVDTIDTFLDLFDESDPMHITLTLDLKRYQREKHKGEYMPVQFLYQLNDTMHIEKTMRMKARGEFRRSHCYLAPFWLNIRQAGVKDEELQNVKRIKIVTHCRGSKDYEEYVLKEYLCYKIYNLISPVSFRVRLVRMTYVDTGRKNKVTEGWAFMIEPEEMLAERHEAVVVKNNELPTTLMRPMEMDILAVFQYMIGNADYSISGRHNIKILGLPGFGSGGYTPVPYDFDYTGFVNAYYAEPGDGLGISSVRERYFLGPCREDDAFTAAIEHINQYREEIMQLVNHFEFLDQKKKKGMIRYLEGYFSQSGRNSVVESAFRRTCY
ncbi:MAG: hypothetical protein U9R49_05840 [Bacteroidota bacterium]|nr:hypothetical protein [Bacteroidota bacterium]